MIFLFSNRQPHRGNGNFPKIKRFTATCFAEQQHHRPKQQIIIIIIASGTMDPQFLAESTGDSLSGSFLRNSIARVKNMRPFSPDMYGWIYFQWISFIRILNFLVSWQRQCSPRSWEKVESCGFHLLKFRPKMICVFIRPNVIIMTVIVAVKLFTILRLQWKWELQAQVRIVRWTCCNFELLYWGLRAFNEQNQLHLKNFSDDLSW